MVPVLLQMGMRKWKRRAARRRLKKGSVYRMDDWLNISPEAVTKKE